MDSEKKEFTAKVFDTDETENATDEITEEYMTFDAIEYEEEKPEVKKSAWLKELYEWTQAIAIAIVVALIINQFFFAIVQVEGDSMLPTLVNKQRLVITKFLYKPEQHDIVIVKSEALGKHIVKRVIAVPGQEIDIDPQTGDVYVDGVMLDEPYIKDKIHPLRVGSKYNYPFVVPEDTVFVMGDNRNNSQDSRSIGVVKFDEIVGKASLRILPLDKFGGLYNDLPENAK